VRAAKINDMQRRQLLQLAGAAALLAQPCARLARAADLPAQVAGVTLPRTPRALAAAAYARAHCPDYLFNHCMRTYLFGALRLATRRRDFHTEDAFIAAALHDLGLLPAFESVKGSFETDGADAAERWARQQGVAAAPADRIWHAVQMHDGAWALTRRQGPEAMLVALGAATDVDGPDPAELGDQPIAQVIAAFPRLKFKQQFTALLIGHCERKPNSQRATWLEGLCRAHAAPSLPVDAVEAEIAAAGFSE
jgi:HD domain